MKITITDDKSTLTLENNESMDSSKTKKLLDILFGSSQPNVSKAKVIAEVARVPTEVPRIVFPNDPSSFEGWLNSEDPRDRARQLSEVVGSDITLCSSIHAIIRRAPSFASELGYSRYMIAAQWLCEQGYIARLPSDISLRCYYNKSLRFARYNGET